MGEQQSEFPLMHPDSPPAKRTPFQEGMKRSADSAKGRWSDEEKAQVDAAIASAARELEDFTSDDVWQRCQDVPITKGMASRLNVAARAGSIENTGQLRICRRGGKHDHAQRLSVWRRK